MHGCFVHHPVPSIAAAALADVRAVNRFTPLAMTVVCPVHLTALWATAFMPELNQGLIKVGVGFRHSRQLTSNCTGAAVGACFGWASR